MWNLSPPPGFQGLHPDKLVTVYMRHLPHWRQAGATYFVTFRQGDSLPRAKLDELEQVRRQWEQQQIAGRFEKPSYHEEQLQELSRETMRRVEQWLDQGMGSCRLRDPAAAKLVVDALHHFDGKRYELDSYVVMPNHVHGILRPLLCEEEPVERILQSWKRHTAREINLLFDVADSFGKKRASIESFAMRSTSGERFSTSGPIQPRLA